uniref:Uncharacterized protein n=1 Tax=Physcomitrium patens TaxID=3218 RepID=A0A2K1IH26_PHYPA|nr:hypothetical protein PHYPA_029174 [Physcomitrium patens]
MLLLYVLKQSENERQSWANSNAKIADIQGKTVWSFLLQYFVMELVSPKFPAVDWNVMVVGNKGEVLGLLFSL